ncbi:hypothetical protein M3Y97_00131300 [Aphelenchoides bicaudatus]|nr:hypothetical protein M3Y97_00131300 [Aphelenchoides bicaudatus]
MSQLAGNSQGIVYHPIQSLVRRMTRFVVSTNLFHLIDHIEEACSALGASTSFLGAQQILVSTTLRRRHVRYVIRIYEFTESGRTRQLVDARCSHGNGVDFKRAFAALRNEMKQHVCKESDSWLRNLGLVPTTILIDIATSEQSTQATTDSCLSAESIVSSAKTL